ncbi:DNA primase [Spiroplasma endosymbiont of Virgichneumon dumeticola]|uniref:DNA primase n=1 Tax=Spiroplasma endosymbiont of Virgichneumon dumeticola TaxID=3139323 RepID=UPI0035C89202
MDLEFNKKVSEIKAKISIVKVISKYLNLIQKGNNFWTICPFHEDSAPSLSISESKQIYKCFACGEQGNVFIFLQKFKNISFINALKEAAESASINLKEYDINLNDNIIEPKTNPLLTINNTAMQFFSYQLLTDSGKKAMNYLEFRNINYDAIKNFNLGYAPSNNELRDYLRAQGYKDSDIINLGLAKINNNDQVIDSFFNRIIFAIKDNNGNCVGFSARSYLEDDKSAKYINSPQSQIFKKGNILYNFEQVKLHLKKDDTIYLTEGFMDTIALSTINIKTSVALMGTNLTQEHIILLKKATNNIIIFLDGDIPGKLACLKIATVLLSQNFKVQIINNNTKYDPDELINKHPNQFKNIIASTIHPFEFAINLGLTQNDIKKDSYQLNAFLKSLLPIWETMTDIVTKRFYLNHLVTITNLTINDLTQILLLEKPLHKETIISKPVISNYQKPQTRLVTKNKIIEAQKQLIFLVLMSRDVYVILEKEKFIFPHQDYMTLYFLISQIYQNETIKYIDFRTIINELQTNLLLDTLQTIINQYKDKEFDLKPRIIIDYLKIINNELIEYEIRGINEQLKNETNLTTQIQLLKQISLLKTKIKQ